MPDVRAAAPGMLGTTATGQPARDGIAECSAVVRTRIAGSPAHGGTKPERLFVEAQRWRGGRWQVETVKSWSAATGGVGRWGVRLKQASGVRTVRILVIEDNASDVFLLDRALKKHDLQFELRHLPTGGEALAFVRRQGIYAQAAIPDLILVDLNLSKYSGEEILREIRAAQHLAGIPVCVWSSSRSRRDEALLQEIGISQFITKPSGLDRFMEIGKTIKDLLAGAEVH
jgi:CheY-like chemotaxis protein